MSLIRSSVLEQCIEFSKRAVPNKPAPEAMEQQCEFALTNNADLPALEYGQWAQGLVITGTGTFDARK